MDNKYKNLYTAIGKEVDSRLSIHSRKCLIDGFKIVPIPLVKRVLCDLSKQAEFNSLFKNYRFSTEQGKNVNSSFFLPELAPSIEELGNIVEGANSNKDNWLNPKLILARLVSSESNNLRTTSGVGSFTLCSNSATNESVNAWIETKEWAENLNNQDTFATYCETFSAVRDKTSSAEPISPVSAYSVSTDDSFVLSFDVGGSNTKCQLYKISDGELELVKEFESVKTKLEQQENCKDENPQYASPKDFAQKLHDNYVPQLKKLDVSVNQIVRIGITYPGAVTGSPFAERIAASSATLGYFKGYSGWVGVTSAEDIFALPFREAFASIFACPVVRMINDGDAHALDAATKLKRSNLIALVCGTGLGMGVVSQNEILDILSESGKIVLDIGCPFPTCGNWPAGDPNKLFSGDGIKKLAMNALPFLGKISDEEMYILRAGDNTEKPSDMEVDRFEQLNDGKNKKTVEDLTFTLLADATAYFVEMLDICTVAWAGGPLTGITNSARIKEILVSEYGEAFSDVEIYLSTPDASISGASGAALAVIEDYQNK